jgi:ligand-binding sensor domain-containing protein
LRSKILLLFLIIRLGGAIHAQNISFERLDEQNGLNQISITALYQDRESYIWIGTENGLVRYDGYTFESMDDSGQESEINNYVKSIHGNSKFLAVMYSDHISFIDPKNLDRKKIPINNNLIKSPKTLFASQESLLITGENGLWKYDFSTKKIENIGIHEPITCIKKIKNGKLLISSVDAFYYYFPFNNKLIKLKYYANSFIRHIAVESEYKISWIEGDGFFHQGKIENGEVQIEKSFSMPYNLNGSSFLSYKNKFFLGTTNGLICIEPNGNFKILTHQEDNFYSLSQSYITALLKDKQGNLWVGTKLGGLNLFNPNRHKFNLISPILSTKYNLCKEIISFVEADDGQIIFQNSTGYLGIYNPSTKDIIKWVQTGIIGNCILKELNNPNSYLIGTEKGLYSYSYLDDKVAFVSTKNEIKNFENDIKFILADGEQTYWMGGDDGLFLYDRKSGQTIEYYGIGNSKFGSENIRSLCKKNENELFVSTMKGLYLFNKQTKDVSWIKLSENPKQPMVSMVKIDRQKNIYVGTAGEGLFIISPNGKTTSISKSNGLVNSQIYTVTLSQDENQCWVSTNKGIASINTKTLEVTNYDLHDGLQGSEFIESSSTITSKGIIYLGGIYGINYFDPSKIKTDSNDCNIVIKGLSLFNQKVPYADYYQVPISKNYISFDFAALDFYLKGSHTYYYQLEGLQKDWTEIGDRRFASFGQLPQGDYIFKVKAKNPDGKLSCNEAKVFFTVVPTYYQQTWFRFLLIILSAASVAFFIYNRIQNAIKEEQENGKQSKMIAELELKALRAQMNPHFIFNSLNSIQDFVLNNEGNLAAKYLSKFARLIRLILDISEQTFVTIHSKIEFLKLYTELEALRMNNSFDYSFEIDPEIDQEALIPTLLIQPHIENAIWHGLQYKTGKKTLSIVMQKTNDQMIKVEIEDNGVGRKVAMEIKKNKRSLHQSKASKISDDRIQSLQKLFGTKPKISIVDKFDENNVACGTKVIMQIPTLNG